MENLLDDEMVHESDKNSELSYTSEYDDEDDEDDDDEDDDDEDEKIDTEWIDTFKEEEHNYNHFYKGPVTSIKLYLFYINSEKELVNRNIKKYTLNNPSILSNTELISLIKHYEEDKKTANAETPKTLEKPKIYKLNAILRYNIDLNPEEIENYVNYNSTDNRFLSTEKYFNDIQFHDSIRLFHDLNSLYFIYIEEEDKNNTINSKGPVEKPHNHTKRIIITTKNNKTMRNKNKKNLKIRKEIR